jgi:hypothetical protein
MQAIPSETGNQELLRRERHQAYKTIDNERSSRSSTQMEDLVGGDGCGMQGRGREKKVGREAASEGEISKWEDWSSQWMERWKEGSVSPPNNRIIECTTLQASSPTLALAKNLHTTPLSLPCFADQQPQRRASYT